MSAIINMEHEPIICKQIKNIDTSRESNIASNTTTDNSRKQSVEYSFLEDLSEVQSNYSNMSSVLESSTDEEISDIWEVSSICTENSMPRVIIKYLHIMSPPDNWQEPLPSVVLRCFTQIYMNRSPTADNEIVDSTNTKGKGIAFNVRGRGSTGKSARALQKGLRKLHNSSSEEGGCNNIEEHEHHQERQQDQDKQSQQNSRILLSYLMLEQEILQNAGVRAREFMKRFSGSQGSQRIYEMVEETYKIILIPEQVLAKVVGVLSAEQKRVQALNAYERLRIAENRHPLARKAAEKVKRFFE